MKKVLLTIFVLKRDGAEALYKEIVRRCIKEQIAGATVLKSLKVPGIQIEAVIEIVDDRKKIQERLLPYLKGLKGVKAVLREVELIV